jgi:hypothetical protein
LTSRYLLKIQGRHNVIQRVVAAADRHFLCLLNRLIIHPQPLPFTLEVADLREGDISPETTSQ